MLDRIRIVLVEPRHPGNIGSAARAMKTMGIEQLVLVNPARFFQTLRQIGVQRVLPMCWTARQWWAVLPKPLQNVIS